LEGQNLKTLLKVGSKRNSGKSFKESRVMKKPKFPLKEKRKIKKEKKKKKLNKTAAYIDSFTFPQTKPITLT
jgi:hypothetical protein